MSGEQPKENGLDGEKVLRRQTKKLGEKLKEKPSVVKAFDVIIEATSDYLRKIFPHIFELTKK